MQPSNPGQRSSDPRALLRTSGPRGLADFLRTRARYVPQERPLQALANAVKRGTPLLLEGTRGSGKTALGDALAAAFNLPKYYLQCHHGVGTGDVLGEWDRTAQSQFVEQQLRGGVPLTEAQAAQWRIEFFNLGEVLAAFDAAAKSMYPPVLIVDEIDKLDERGEDYLLQVLAEGYAHIPRLRPDSRVGVIPNQSGTVGQEIKKPIVILTSNNMRGGVSSPLRSRCRYSFIKHPTPAEEVMILHTRVPNAAPELLAQTIKLMKAIRAMGSIVEKPGIRESREFLETVVQDGAREITVEVINANIDGLAKCETDVENIDTGALNLSKVLRLPHTDIDRWVREAFAQSASPMTGSAPTALRQTAR